MKKDALNTRVKEHYEEYLSIKVDPKASDAKDVFLKPKDNHKDREVADIQINDLLHDREFTLRFYGNKDWASKYAINLFCKEFMETACYRFDSFGDQHVNYKNNPLKKRVVTTPHFNEFDSDGIEIAYKSPELENPQYNVADRIAALKLFARIHNIDLDDNIAFHSESLFKPQGGIVDPLIGVDFQ